jgi:hypothetical protein
MRAVTTLTPIKKQTFVRLPTRQEDEDGTVTSTSAHMLSPQQSPRIELPLTPSPPHSPIALQSPRQGKAWPPAELQDLGQRTSAPH